MYFPMNKSEYKYTKNAFEIREGERIQIGRTFENIPIPLQILGLPLIYLPVFVCIPFMILGLNLVRWHLLLMGAKNLKKYRDFIPHRKTYRYAYKNQIKSKSGHWFTIFARTKLFWFYNCGIYCPLTIGLLEYFSYLVMVVENWWCPFFHDKKSNYNHSALDKSYWHITKQKLSQLHPDDRNCPTYDDKKKL